MHLIEITIEILAVSRRFAAVVVLTVRRNRPSPIFLVDRADERRSPCYHH